MRNLESFKALDYIVVYINWAYYNLSNQMILHILIFEKLQTNKNVVGILLIIKKQFSKTLWPIYWRNCSKLVPKLLHKFWSPVELPYPLLNRTIES